MSLNNKKGFTLIELVIVTAIISIVAAVAIPQFTAYKSRAYDTNVKANLRAVFTACQEYWTSNSSFDSCLISTISNSGFGFTPSADVDFTIDSEVNNTEQDFYATARHASSSNIFSIDYRGIVSLVGGEGNNGPGCSAQAKSKPKELDKKAEGGCGTAKGKKGKK